MKNYYRLMLGRNSAHAPECIAGGFVGVDFGIKQDLASNLPEEWRVFNREFIPIYLEVHPEKSKVAEGLACGALWTVSKGLKEGDIVLSPDGLGHYNVGGVAGDYMYEPEGVLPHRRPVRWSAQTIDRADMSEALQRSTGSIGTIAKISGYREEIENLIAGITGPTLISTDETVEDAAAFAMESHLEDFLVRNWAQTDLAKEYDIFQEEDECVGQQYPTDTGSIDILAISKDKKTLLVLELKKGRASDVVVGQTLRYMGYVQEELAEKNQDVRGVIMAMEDDQRIRRALAVTPSIDLYLYQISFKLMKA
jgi:restriction system protein